MSLRAGLAATVVAALLGTAALGDAAPTAPPGFWPWLKALRGSDAMAQLRTVNLYVNRRIAFATDVQAWGKADYWASPLEALRQGRGDCEDYAITKYFSLLSAGVSAARLRLVYVRARLDDGEVQAHMVLAYHPVDADEVLILDNLIDDVLPASRRSDLSPVFSFNSEGLWEGLSTTSAGDPAARLSRWRNVMRKAHAEGFY